MMERLKNILRSKLAQNGIWLILLQGFNTLVPLLTIPYITRTLSQTAYGQFSLVLNWVGYFQVIVEYGFGYTGARKTATNSEHGRLQAMRSRILLARGILLVISAAAFLLIAVIFSVEPGLYPCIAILFLLAVATVFQQNWLFQGMEDMKTLAMISMVSRTISVVLIFLLVKKPDDLLLYCVLYVSTNVISSIVGNILASRKYRLGWGKMDLYAAIREMREGWPLFVSSAMTKIFGSIGVTVLGFVAAVEVVGIYNAISKIPYVLTLLVSSLGQALYPKSCRMLAENFEQGLQRMRKIAIPVVGFFGLSGLGIMLLCKPLVYYVFGADYSHYAMLLIPLILWVMAGIVNNFLGIQILVASGHQQEYSRAFTISVAVMLALILVFGNLWGVYGIASASMLAEYILTILLWRNVQRIAETEMKNELKVN